MRPLRDNLVIQFSVISFVVMVLIAVTISFTLTTRLNNNVDLLEVHGEVMMAGDKILASDPFSIPSLQQQVLDLRWITYGMLGGGFVILYVSLISIVWRGWSIIDRQRRDLRSLNDRLEGQVIELNQQIIDRINAEEALTNSKAQLGAVLNTVAEGIINIDSDGTIVMVNQEVQDVFGYQQEELVGNNLQVLMPGKYRELHAAGLKRYIDTGIAHILGRGLELEGLKKDGSTFPLEVRITETKIGEHLFYTGAVRDITERKKLEADLIQAQKMDAIGHLAAGVAHDFNNLLTPILGNAQIAIESMSPEDKHRNRMEGIERAAQRGSDLTRRLLTFSRHDGSQTTVLNLNSLILTTESMLRRLIKEDIELVTLPAAESGVIKTDSAELEQVLVNLVINASDAMPSGGKIIIETANNTVQEDPGKPPKEYITLSVTDTGIGIPEEVQEHIFEPFFTTKESGQGTGLGLSTCRSIVSKSGGYITFDSKVDAGSTFKVNLPLTEEASDASSAGGEPQHTPAGYETVMLVEDEEMVRSFTATLLREDGYIALEANNGAEALRLFEGGTDEQIHLLLTDLVMPLMGGRELADRVRMAQPDIKVLYMSGYSEYVMSDIEKLDPRTEFIPKPFNPASLRRQVRELLDR